MKQEEKQLLLKDLCARIPYTPLVLLNGKEHCLLIGIDGVKVYLNTDSESFDLSESSIKPYLRPMSSMTEEEKEEYDAISSQIKNFYGREAESKACSCLEDWLNAHHFDYRGLIEKGLALEAPEGMY